MSEPEQDHPDALSELARRRREQAEEESQKARPDMVEAVTQSEVRFIFPTYLMPYGDADPVAVSDRLLSMYGVDLQPPNIAPLLKTMSREELSRLDDESLLRRLVRDSSSDLRWTNGKFPLRDDYVKVRAIEINFESIYVVVAGTSQVAEVIVQEVFETLATVAGVRRRYADVAAQVLHAGYATATKLDLGVPFNNIVSPKIYSYLSDNMVTGGRFAAYMHSSASGEDANVLATVNLDTVEFRVTVMNMNNGYSSKHELSFTVTSQSDYGTGRVVMRSGLPYDKHVALVAGLFST